MNLFRKDKDSSSGNEIAQRWNCFVKIKVRILWLELHKGGIVFLKIKILCLEMKLHRGGIVSKR